MEGEAFVPGGPDHVGMQVAAEEIVRNSESVKALAEQVLTGVGPPLRTSLPGDGQQCPHVSTRNSLSFHHTAPEAVSPGRRDVLHQMQVRVSPANGSRMAN